MFHFYSVEISSPIQTAKNTSVKSNNPAVSPPSWRWQSSVFIQNVSERCWFNCIIIMTLVCAAVEMYRWVSTLQVATWSPKSCHWTSTIRLKNQNKSSRETKKCSQINYLVHSLKYRTHWRAQEDQQTIGNNCGEWWRNRFPGHPGTSGCQKHLLTFSQIQKPHWTGLHSADGE